MGNSLGGKKSAKVMKISGETIKLRTPVQAGSVLEHYPGHVLLESEAVKEHGYRAKPLEPQQELKPRRLYFLVELPKVPEDNKNKIGARRVRSGIQMSAKDRLENLMLARRSSSDLSVMTPPSPAAVEEEKTVVSENGGGVRVRMRLPKAEVERLMAESKDGAEAADKIARLCMESGGVAANGGGNGGAVRRSDKSRETSELDFCRSAKKRFTTLLWRYRHRSD
ncbi:hypothetical protein CASFOL_004151 [Castilleja foliolosa]|uniref:Plastid movement impaired 2 n=1 Tax=Castilleja foliolosa TaxID=1961234 RepID=A0ABD3EJM0_9LAMI